MQWIIQAAISLVLSQLGKISWPDVTAKVIALVDGYVPAAFQPTANAAVSAVVAVLQGALTDAADISAIVTDVAAGNMAGALAALEALLAKALHPSLAHAAVLAAVIHMKDEHLLGFPGGAPSTL